MTETDVILFELTHQFELLLERLNAAIIRDERGGSTRADGWPRGHSEGRSTGPTITVPDENGDPDTIPVTAVEAAVIAREHTAHDEHHDLIGAATRQARTIRELIARRDIPRLQNAIARLDGLLAGIDRLLTGTTIDHTEPGCSSCARYKDAIGQEHFTARFRGDLCQWCYGWINDKINNPKRAQPPLALIARRARGERITTTIVANALARR